MSDDLLTRLKNGEVITSDDAEKSTGNLTSVKEGYEPKNYTIEKRDKNGGNK